MEIHLQSLHSVKIVTTKLFPQGSSKHKRAWKGDQIRRWVRDLLSSRFRGQQIYFNIQSTSMINTKQLFIHIVAKLLSQQSYVKGKKMKEKIIVLGWDIILHLSTYYFSKLQNFSADKQNRRAGEDIISSLSSSESLIIQENEDNRSSSRGSNSEAEYQISWFILGRICTP